MSGRSYLSIGDVLTLLRQEFPDVTISKIRFLESQGLVNPERTPSGYRKFYEQDVERLRWVLRQQREHFLPLKVIKDRLGDDANGSESSTPAETGGVAAPRSDRSPDEPARAVDPVLVGQGARGVTPSASTTPTRPAVTDPVSTGGGPPTRMAVDVPAPVPPSRLAGSGGTSSLYDQEESEGPTLLPVPTDDRGGAVRTTDHDPGAAPRRAAQRSQPTSATPTGTVTSPPPDPPAAKPAGTGRPARPPKPAGEPRAGGKRSADPSPAPDAAAPASGSGGGKAKPKPADARAVADMAGMSGASLTLDELSTASGLDIAVIEELCQYGLLAPSRVGGGEYYDEEALAVANLVAAFARFGIEPRHLRLYKNAAEREAGFVEQIVLPLVRQRNPEARAKANDTADQLIQLGQGLRSSLLRKALRDLLGS